MRKLAALLCVCILLCGSAAVAQTTPPQAIAVGEVVTGTLTQDVFDPATQTWLFGVHVMFFELTAPSDGTLAAYLTGNFAALQIDGIPFDLWGPVPLVGTMPVTAGQTYSVLVYDLFPFDPMGQVFDGSFVLTTTLFPTGAAVPIGCRIPSPVPGWVCINGDWMPPDHPEALAAGSSPPPAPPAPPVPPAVPPGNTCVTPQPVPNWVCINGDWIPPDHPEAIANAGTLAPPPAPPPPAAPPTPAAANCTTRDPFLGIPGLYGVCVGTEWYPVGHPQAPAGIAVTGVQPPAGPIGNRVRIFGVGFQPDTQVTFGGVPATDIFVESGGSIFVVAPPHFAGPVDVAVQNPGGVGATFAQAYTYHPVTLTVTPAVVSPRGLLTVTWVAPPAPFQGDWIGLYKVGDPNEAYLWYEYTGGTNLGSIQFFAPLQPGSYEFRYLPDDGYYDAARSVPITVIGGSLQ